MSSRVVQFFRGISAKAPNRDEQNMISDLLPAKARQAFYRMNLADQRHSLNVLADARALAGAVKNIDMALLQRCCLLHDIGRGPDMDSLKKSYAVLLDKFFHNWAMKQGQAASKAPIKDMMYRYYHHAELSCTLLQEMGLDREARIVLRHHSGEKTNLSSDEVAILDLLMQADEMN